MSCSEWRDQFFLFITKAIIQRWRTYGTRAQSGTRDDFAWNAQYRGLLLR